MPALDVVVDAAWPSFAAGLNVVAGIGRASPPVPRPMAVSASSPAAAAGATVATQEELRS